jgi:hypothetical protein
MGDGQAEWIEQRSAVCGRKEIWRRNEKNQSNFESIIFLVYAAKRKVRMNENGMSKIYMGDFR